MESAESPKPLVWINGFPGVGKLTVARELLMLYTKAQVVLIDNHQLIDPVAARLQRDDPEYYVERRKERQKALERWALNRDERHRLVVFTGDPLTCSICITRDLTHKADYQSKNELSSAVGAEYKDAALRAGRVFIPVVLHCDQSENLKRAVSTERQESGTTKLTDVEILAELRAEHVMLTFDQPTQLGLDVSELSPSVAARKLYEHIACIELHVQLKS
ncbi:hypothetical protein CB0940_04051 [Cercospora beticola]|uniref:Uncharacterized protein n=1 Tax=Cercospora beticola TaxID=122368 RepID=A0A2G5HL53_CERBT|nr:hypothetical protein CB0940_04051 [Cercospora beticola]PIA93296.1 hypothetical protein CB0940_04051 [Cercospora beticola]WPB01262.1 hypothetical protein RHO25_005886 [Cercospora beticola]